MSRKDKKQKIEKPKKLISDKKRKTYARFIHSAIVATIVIIVALIVLQFLGINVSSMLAGVGIVSIVVGFALQDAMKDIFRGFEIVSDNYFNIGDVVQYNNYMGQVQNIGLRTTRIQDFNTMNIVSIANRNIDEIEIVSEYIYLDIPLPHEVKLTTAEDAIKDIVKAIKKLQGVSSVDYQGINAVSTKSFDYQLAITCDPVTKQQIRRSALRIIVAGLTAHKISIPYTELQLAKTAN